MSLLWTAQDLVAAMHGRPLGELPEGITGVCNADGRVTILMPHPERSVAGTTGSWWPESHRSGAVTPWAQMFHNARRWVG